ncbi:MAG: hypothetical protein JWO48_906 [Bryobacterales bacterium]|nr:hypothetical protein [Bryobacterales bacterium]
MRRLSPSGRMQKTWTDGRPTAQVVSEFIKPNDRLTSFERIEIYNRQYWFRLIDCLHDDYPGLRAVVGQARFSRLVVEYLDRYPSRCFTLRNLGSRLEQFLAERPELIQPRAALAMEMARFEWAQVVAFDGEAKKPVTVDDLLGVNPARLRLALQPYITLLELHWPLDDWSIALKKSVNVLRSEASNAVESEQPKAIRRPKLPKKEAVFVAVHRYENSLYYKRLEPEAFRMLSALRDGRSLESAVAVVTEDDSGRDWSAEVQKWFANWTSMGWFCRRK